VLACNVLMFLDDGSLSLSRYISRSLVPDMFIAEIGLVAIRTTKLILAARNSFDNVLKPDLIHP
jgi:hypothetical protein